MRVRITVTDDEGRIFEGEADVSAAGGRPSGRPKRPSPRSASRPSTALVFSLNPRTFMNRYARSGSGAQKFTLLLACLAKGDPAREVAFDKIKSQWGKTKSLIGKFNPAYSIRAKDNGWVDTKKAGVYVLTASWKDAIPSQSGTE
jgi:hypothetical protein